MARACGLAAWAGTACEYNESWTRPVLVCYPLVEPSPQYHLASSFMIPSKRLLSPGLLLLTWQLALLA